MTPQRHNGAAHGGVQSTDPASDISGSLPEPPVLPLLPSRTWQRWYPRPQASDLGVTRILRELLAAGELSEATQRACRADIATWVLWCISQQFHPWDATRADIDRWNASMRSQDVSASTRARRLSVLARYFELAVRDRLMDEQPVQGSRPRG